MAELGVIASVVGILGFGGQAIQGCQFLKGLIDNVKEAPEEINSLRKQLDLVETTIYRVNQLTEEAKQAEVELPDISSDVQFCQETIRALERHIGPSLSSFNESQENDGPSCHSGKRGHRRRWQQLKVAFNTPKTKELISKLEQSKSQLFSAQASIIQSLQLKQHNLSKELMTSANLLRGSSLASATVLNKTHAATQETLDVVRRLELSTSMMYEQTKATTNDIITVGRATQANVDSLNIHFSETAVAVENMRADFNAVFGSEAFSKVIDGMVHNALARHFGPDIDAAQGEYVSKSKPSSSRIHTRSQNALNRRTAYQRPNKKGLSTKRTEYQMLICTIRVETTKAVFCEHLDSEIRDDKRSSRVRNSTTIVDIRFNPIFLKSGFQICFLNQRYSTGLNMQLRSYRQVSCISPLFKAAGKGDLLAVRQLFETGMASPFDVDEYGFSLVDQAMLHINMQSCEDQFHLVNFLLESGTKWTLRSSRNSQWWVKKVLEDATYGPGLLRLLINSCEHDPFEGSDISIMIPTELVELPAYRVLVENDQWDIDLQNREPSDFNGRFVENDRLMLSDIEGNGLRGAIRRGLCYDLVHDGSFIRISSPLHLVLLFASFYKREDVKTACSHRLAHLIRNGSNPRQGYAFSKYWVGCNLSGEPSTVAKQVGTVDIWRNGLELAGWTPSRINDLLDDEAYFGVPDLFTGIHYSTVKENCEEFFERLVTGHYSSIDESRIEELSFELGANIANLHQTWGEQYEIYFQSWGKQYDFFVQELIKAVNRALKQRSTPGGWTEDEEVRLTPGIDFEVPFGWEDWWDAWHDDDEDEEVRLTPGIDFEVAFGWEDWRDAWHDDDEDEDNESEGRSLSKDDEDSSDEPDN